VTAPRRTGEGPPRPWRRRLRRVTLGLAVAYPLALLLAVFALHGIGERWPVTTLALYLPRVGFGLPLPFLAIALGFVRPRRWLLTQAAAAAIVLFPLMGLELPPLGRASAAGPRLRLMSWNVGVGPDDPEGLMKAVRAVDADIVCLQQVRGDELGPVVRALPRHFVRLDKQFIFASRYPIVDAFVPATSVIEGERFSPSFARYRVRTPLGLVDVYDVHPLSPHGPFDKFRGAGLVGELASGRLFRNHAAFGALARNTRIRERQVTDALAHAARSPYPVLIAGDTNLPSGSPVLRAAFGAYRDGFVEVGRGFGYTYPARKSPPWLRLDRILSDPSFRFVSFVRLDVHVATHFPVVAELDRVSVAEDPDGAAPHRTTNDLKPSVTSSMRAR
jgi:endonuclease/exonuclease/phosphatase family metal-dependent hydrolase